VASSLQIEEDVPLAPFTTLRIGGPARFFVRATSEDELLEAIRFARARDLRVFILGGGSNLLISDAGFNGLVIHLALAAPTVFSPDSEWIIAEAAAGTEWNSFVLDACTRGLGGVECLAGIPGLTGGTPVQNVGAYGQEVAQTIDRVTVLDLESLTFTHLANSECRFAYRTSRFNTSDRNRHIVTSVRFRLIPDAIPTLTYADLRQHFSGNPTPTLLEVYEAVRAIRHAKGMLLVDDDPDCRSAGSFFKNPIVPTDTLAVIASTLSIDPQAIPNWPTAHGFTKLPAAWLLDQAGFRKGFTLGPAGISSRHTLALINRTGTATCADILHLRDTIAAEVSARFHVTLEQEPVYLS
jgi:UDP-N-acetylmuramate dehydrogenase